jgi:Rhodanese-like domain
MRLWTLPLLISLGAIASLGCSRSVPSPGSTHSDSDLKSLTVDEVSERIARHDGKIAVFDCNSKERFAESHVPGARWVSFHELTVADLPADKATALVFYCAHRL